MFKIVAPTQMLLKFFLLLKLNFAKPQQRHLVNFMDALLACEGTKTIARLNELILEPTDQSAFTDFFTVSPWSSDHLRQQQQQFSVQWLLQGCESSLFQKPIFICIDDSKSEKPKSSLHFEVTDWFFNTPQGRGYFYGVSFINVHLSCGDQSIPVALKLYLREKTVRRINRRRQKNKRIQFKSKNTLVKEILQQLAERLPTEAPVYVLFDSWYASAKLINYCRHRGWQVICALKHNRKFKPQGQAGFKQLHNHARYLRNKDFNQIMVKSSDSSSCYHVKTLSGFLNEINDQVSIFISKRHPKDRNPEFFMTTDLSLSAQQALNYYTRRWAVEVDHLYLKVRLGLSDFRLRSYEGIARYFDLVCLTLAYLHWRRVETRHQHLRTLSDVIALHREDQQRSFLRYFGKQILKIGSVNLAIAKIFKQAA